MSDKEDEVKLATEGEDKAAKKKKKPKKKEEKKEQPTKKAAPAKKDGPGKKQLAFIKEQLKLQQDADEKQKREEEERIRKEEEAEEKRLEQLRLEKERKERKKQKEKEKKERQKKEGTYLTAKQKADLQRAKMSIEILKKRGLAVVGKVKKDESQKTPKIADANGSENVNEKENENNEEDAEDEVTEVTETDDDVKGDWDEIDPDEIVADKVVENVKLESKTENKASKPSLKKQSSQVIEPPKEEESKPTLRSPIICVLGHVDTGKTKLLDYIRHTHVQDNEAGGITQQIGATFVPPSAINDQCKGVKTPLDLKIPGLLIIDTPGHESFTNLRSRGSSLCDIAILVVDIMHGLEPQTLESINLLKARKTPFIVALNKIDRLYNWKSNHRKDIEDVIRSQPHNTKLEFEQRMNEVILQLNQEALNASVYYQNPDPRAFVSLVPTSATSGDGMGNLISLLVSLSQNMLSKRLLFEAEKLEATVLEVKALHGLGTTVDVILVNGKLSEGDRIVLAGYDGPIVTHIRALLVPQPLRELRVKSPYQELKEIYGSIGVKIAGHDLEKAIAGLELHVAQTDAEVEQFKEECWDRFGKAMKAIKCSDKGVYVQASTLGSLEALLEFLNVSKIPYSGVRIGPVVKRDVHKASAMLTSAPDYAVILAFDVRIEKDAQELADKEGVKIFQADIIYHLFDKFTAYRDDLKNKRREQYKSVAVFPCKLRILPNCIFNARDPIVVGVSVEDGILVTGTPIAVPSKGNLDIGRVSSLELNHKPIDNARRGQEVCIKIEHLGGDAPKLYGRHFDHQDMLMSRVSRESIDAVKEYFRDDMQKSDWQLLIELKKIFEVM